jgi:hypothetical protein
MNELNGFCLSNLNEEFCVCEWLLILLTGRRLHSLRGSMMRSYLVTSQNSHFLFYFSRIVFFIFSIVRLILFDL